MPVVPYGLASRVLSLSRLHGFPWCCAKTFFHYCPFLKNTHKSLQVVQVLQSLTGRSSIVPAASQERAQDDDEDVGGRSEEVEGGVVEATGEVADAHHDGDQDDEQRREQVDVVSLSGRVSTSKTYNLKKG